MDQIVKAHCNSCLRKTNHLVVAEKKVSWENEDDGMSGADSYEIVTCLGCDTIRFRQVTTGDYIMDQQGNDGESISYFPSAVSRQKPDWTKEVDFFREHKEIGSLLDEIYVALHEDLNVIAGTGVRTLVDMVITEKVGDIGSFAAKLQAVHQLGLISTANKQFLEETINAGSASAHRGFKPSQADLKLLLNIAEDLISSIYVLPEKVKAMSKRVPRRKRRKPKKFSNPTAANKTNPLYSARSLAPPVAAPRAPATVPERGRLWFVAAKGAGSHYHIDRLAPVGPLEGCFHLAPPSSTHHSTAPTTPVGAFESPVAEADCSLVVL